MPNSSSKDISQKFAEYLYISGISDTFKQEILTILPELSHEQIGKIFSALQNEKMKREKLELQFELELKKTNLPKKLQKEKAL